MNKLLFILFLFITPIYGQNHILVGDSQTYFLQKYTSKIKQVKKLCKPGIGVVELNSKILSYPIKKDVKTISICIGVNDYYKDKGIDQLMTTTKRTFPNAKIFIIKGSWNWGKTRIKNTSIITSYYKLFEKLGGLLINTPIGKGDPHRYKKVYQKIINEIEEKI
jgi:hypothetical protein